MNHLFIMAHPDDEILACCGTILRLKDKGNRVAVVIMSDRSRTRENGLYTKIIETHKGLCVDKTYIFGLDMMKFDKEDRFETTRKIEEVIKEEKPDVIYTHDHNDIHNDHRTLSRIVLEAAKLPLRGCDYDKKIRAIYTVEVPSSTDWGTGFVPNAFVEISETALKIKEALLLEYDGVIREKPHPRNFESFKALARYRGGQCGCEYAEAYRKIFEVSA